MKPALPWIISSAGLLLLAGAMAWATHSLVGMERIQHRMAAEAAVQERSRLALWRMESIAASLVIEESARPADQYRGDPAEAPALSPASRIRLHFELDADGRVRSPQVAEGPDKPPVPDEAGFRLQELRARLAEKASTDQWALLGQPPQGRGIADNRMWLNFANQASPPPDPASPAPSSAGLQRQSDFNSPAAPAPADYAPPRLPSALKPSEAKLEQESVSQKEADRRQQAAGNLAKLATSQRRLMEENARGIAVDNLSNDAAPKAKKSRADKEALPTTAAAPAPAAASITETAAALNVEENQDLFAVRDLMVPQVSISDFRALWIKDALFLTRRVSQAGASVIQGAWVDWPVLRAELLASVSDLFPAAGLEPAPSGNAGGTDLLASLPIRFLPGGLEVAAPPFWSPLKLSLATAWGCVLLAGATVTLVLRAMMLLSDRRAAFVSAVTHELRTPLATFKLYSEMLADGLVKDPAKRQSYLETLTTEADRLGHLVENVLAYSRLERGRGSDGKIRTTLGDLIQRVEPRLHQRVATCGAQFTILRGEVPDSFELMTDPAAVEQILFNLVDNACKYGCREGAPAHLEWVIERGPAVLEFSIRDHGPGLTRAEARKLFRPFHKSAREAAHSAPGVGLGLALCRRLARDLGGMLNIDHTWPHGACFVLTLPLVT